MEPDKKVEEPAIAYGTEITSLDQLDLTKLYSYADYFKWKFEERVELIRGFIHKMSPGPNAAHQKIAKKLVLKIGNFFEGKKCEMFFAPFDVRLPDSTKQTDDNQVFTVVQPDIFVVCNPAKIDRRGCIGAPDLVIEVLSPGNTAKEMGIKFDLYEESGVKEYWLVEPVDKTILVYTLRGGKYVGLKPFTEKDEIASPLFPGLKFKVGEVLTVDTKYGNIVEEPAIAYGTGITSLDQLDLTKLYSYADYFKWKFSERVELIRGLIHKMSPAPTAVHQSTALGVTLKVGNYFKNRACRVFPAPFDVRLPDSGKQTDDELVFTVVQPDLCVICDPAKIDKRGCIGAPDLVVEILSPGSTKKDRQIKFGLYEENGVKEYWLVEPAIKMIRVYVLREGKYVGIKPFTEDDEMVSLLFPELKFNVGEVFDEELRPENLVEDPPEHYGPEIVSLDQLSFSALYSYADYFRWKFEERVELIRGILYEMSAPTTVHQLVFGDLFWEIKTFFKGKTCKVFAAPFDVRLPDSRKYTDDNLVFTVVQPDICVVCDPAKIDDRGCVGVPDLVVEIVSKGSKKKDREIKFSLYEENGVKEYWLVEPRNKTIEVYVLKEGRYVSLKLFTEEDKLASALFPGLEFRVEEVFTS